MRYSQVGHAQRAWYAVEMSLLYDVINFCQKPATYRKFSSLLEQEVRLPNYRI
jgi:hypothetical protein